MTIHYTTTEPLTEAERVALDNFVRSLRQPKPEPSLLEHVSQAFDESLLGQPLAEAWVLAHDLVPNWCNIEHAKSHIFHQCAEVDSTRYDPANHPRCNRHLGHDGEHDFP